MMHSAFGGYVVDVSLLIYQMRRINGQYVYSPSIHWLYLIKTDAIALLVKL